MTYTKNLMQYAIDELLKNECNNSYNQHTNPKNQDLSVI